MAEDEEPTKLDELLAAAKEGDIDTMKPLLDAGEAEEGETPAPPACQVDERDPKTKDTALHRAAAAGKTKAVEWLVGERKANPNVQNADGYTALHSAVVAGRLRVVMALISGGVDVNVAAQDGQTALHLCVVDDEHPGAARLKEICDKILHSQGVNINALDKKGDSALHKCLEQKNMDMLQFLLKHGANVDVPNASGATPLYAAAATNDVTALDVLIAGGAVLEVGDANGLTPLLAAVKSGYESAALVLVDRGASIGIKDSQGRTALHYACDAVATGKMQELACALVDAGSDVNAVDANGEKPLLNEDLSVYIQSKQVADPVKNGVERTLAMIKPDAVRRGLAQTIIGVATAQGFAVVGRRHLQLTPSRAAEFYAEHNGRPFFKDLVKFMSSGPIVVLILAKVNAIAEWRALMGPTNVATAKASAPKSIRARFGTDFPIFPFHKEEAGRPGTTNATHGSDSLVSAGREIRFYFPAAASEVVPALEWTSAYVSDKMNTVLLQGLTELSKEKPTDPIVWLGEWLLRNNPAKPQIASR